MKLQQLRYFYAACSCKSISLAAEKLHVSQPSVSMSIHEPEREFGAPLISRCYKGFVLTEEGAALEEMAESLLRHADHVNEEMLSFGQRQKPVCLGVPPMIGTSFFPLLYKELRSKAPELLLNCEETGAKTLIHNLRENVLDLVLFAHEDPPTKEFAYITIGKTEMLWCALAEHPLAAHEIITPELLKNEPLVFLDDSFIAHELVRQRFADYEVKPNVLHTTQQLSTFLNMVSSGIASGFMLHFLANSQKGLITRPFHRLITLDISLIWRKNAALSRGTKQLIQLCQQDVFAQRFR